MVSACLYIRTLEVWALRNLSVLIGLITVCKARAAVALAMKYCRAIEAELWPSRSLPTFPIVNEKARSRLLSKKAFAEANELNGTKV